VDKSSKALKQKKMPICEGRQKYEVWSAKERSEVGESTKFGRQKNETVAKGTKWEPIARNGR
jgi:hypothetical protein